MSGTLVIGLDIGTSGARAVLYNASGAELASEHVEYPLETPRPGWAEQDPDRVWTAATNALAAVARQVPAGKSVAAIGLSTIFHSLVVADRDGKAITPSIIWADLRARRQVEQLRARLDPMAVYRRTGCPLHPMYLPGKILWLREQQPDVFGGAAWFGSIKDEIVARLTGQRVVDRSVATASGLYNFVTSSWDEEILRAIGTSVEQLPRVVEPTDLAGTLLPDVARAVGLAAETPVIAGAGDGVLSTLGTGSVAPGQMTVMIGTSGAARVAVDRPVVDDQARTWCYYLAKDRWIAGAAINNGGLALQWVRENLVPGPAAPDGEFDFETLVTIAQQAPVGSGGLIFLPFISGERAPYWNANARGILFGLATHLGPPHVARSVFEGVCYRMRSIVDALDEVAGPTTEIRATGGFTRSEVWRQMLADVLNRPMLQTDAAQASAFGAAGLALIGIGALRDLADIAKLVHVSPGPIPDAATHQIYDRIYRIYFDIYWANQKTFTQVAELQEDLG
jgi:gluconokinase